jgi:hypothetical protein
MCLGESSGWVPLPNSLGCIHPGNCSNVDVYAVLGGRLAGSSGSLRLDYIARVSQLFCHHARRGILRPIVGGSGPNTTYI